MSPEEREAAGTRLGLGAEAPDRENAELRMVSVSDLNNMDVYNTEGEEIGSVSDVVVDASDSHFIVIGQGGFFGMGGDNAALPAERFWIDNDRLVVAGITEADLDGLGRVRTGDNETYNDVDNDVMVEVAIWENN